MGLLAVCLLLPACASATYAPSKESSGSTSKEGAYFEAAGIYSSEAFRPGFPLSGGTNSHVGAGVRLGYRGDNGTAFELFADDARGYSLDYPTGEDTSVEIRSLGLAGKYYLAEDERKLQPYALLGAGWASVHFSRRSSFDPASGIVYENPYLGPNDSFFVRGGIGCEFHFNATFGFFAEASYSFMAKHLRSFDHMDGIAGLLVRF
jgi:hypothetical protein